MLKDLYYKLEMKEGAVALFLFSPSLTLIQKQYLAYSTEPGLIKLILMI